MTARGGGATADTGGEMRRKRRERVLQNKNALTLVRGQYKINESLLVTHSSAICAEQAGFSVLTTGQNISISCTVNQ